MTSNLLSNPEATATVLSILTAVIAGLFGYRQNNDRHRREYTLNVLAPLLANDRLFKTHDAVVNYRIKNLQPDYATVQTNEREDILQLLGYYEFLSAAFMRGDLDRQTVLSQRKSTFRYAFETLKPFIDARRTLLSNNRVYCDFEEFVTRYCRQC